MFVSDGLAAAELGAGAAVFGGIIGGMLSGAYQHMRERYKRPVLTLDFQDSSAHGPRSPYMPDTHWHEDGELRPWLVVRAKVANTGRSSAKGCRVFLLALNEIHEGKITPSDFQNPMALPWPGWDFESRDMPQQVSSYVDVVRFRKDVGLWNFPFRNYPGDLRLLDGYTGTYRFQVIFTADNAESVACTIDVEYRKDWNGLRAWRVTG